MEILFVCKGNVGRSQMAEILFRKINKKHKVTSAGIKVNEEEGEKLKDIPLAEPVIRFMRKEGFDASENFRKQITKKMVDNADKVIVMAEKEIWPDFLINNPKVVFWDIEDPKGISDEGYKNIISYLRRLIGEMHDKLLDTNRR